MKCPSCKTKIGDLKKYKIHECKCGGKLMCIEINKKKELVDLRRDKGE